MKKILITTAAVLLLTSCSNKTKKTLGLTEDMPDEFQVKKAKPLEVPPHFIPSRQIEVKSEKKVKNKLSPAEKEVIKEVEKM